MVRTTVQEDSSEAPEQMRKSHQGRGPHGLSMTGAPVHGGPHGLTMVSLVPSSPLVFLWLFVYVWQFCRFDFSHKSNFYCFIPLYSIFLSSTSIILIRIYIRLEENRVKICKDFIPGLQRRFKRDLGRAFFSLLFSSIFSS